MGGTKCLRLGTCELKYMGGVLQRNPRIRATVQHSIVYYNHVLERAVNCCRLP